MTLEEIEKKRIELSRKNIDYKKLSKLFTGLIIFFFILFPLTAMGTENFGAIFFIMVCFMGSGFLATRFKLKASKVNEEFENAIKDKYIADLLNKNYDQAVFIKTNHLSISKVLTSKLIKQPDEFEGEDYISGSYKELSFEFSDLKFVTVTKSSKGKKRRTTFFAGTWYIFEFKKNLDGIIKIYEKNLGVNNNGLKKIETEMIYFNNKFNIYTNNEQLFFKIINPYMIENLLNLEKMHIGSIHYVFMNNQLHVGINSGLGAFSPDINTPITLDTIKRLEEEVLFPKLIIDILKLDQIQIGEEYI